MRYGCAHVAGKYPTSSSFLTDGFNSLKNTFGFEGYKFFLGPNYTVDYPNQVWGSVPTTLTQLASTTPFSTVFGGANSGAFFYLNCWSFANGVNNPWVDGINSTQMQAEYQEIYDLVVHLRNTYSNLTFYIQQWEGDWSLIGSFDPGKAIPYDRHQRMKAFYKKWRQAINDAVAATTGTVQIVFGIEINRTLDGNIDRAWYDILPEVAPDAISWSAYEGINSGWAGGQSSAESSIATLFERFVKKVRQAMPNTPIYLGEFGFPEAEPSFTGPGLNVGNLIQKVIDVGDSLGVTASVYWNWTDNEEISPGNPRGYYLIKPDTTMSGAGIKWLAIL